MAAPSRRVASAAPAPPLERVDADERAEAGAGISAPSVSADGRFVACASSAGNLAPGDANFDPSLGGRGDGVLLRDLERRRITTVVSGPWSELTLSADGHTGVFDGDRMFVAPRR